VTRPHRDVAHEAAGDGRSDRPGTSFERGRFLQIVARRSLGGHQSATPTGSRVEDTEPSRKGWAPDPGSNHMVFER
jgi:hypothetical protein